MKDQLLFQGEIITKQQKLIDKIKKKILSRTTGSISTKLGAKHPWVKGNQVSNEGPRLFPRRDNYEIAKIQ